MNPILEPLADEVTQAKTVMASATALISGFGARVNDAVSAALDNGATAEQLAPFTELEAALETERVALANAVIANTPSA